MSPWKYVCTWSVAEFLCGSVGAAYIFPVGGLYRKDDGTRERGRGTGYHGSFYYSACCTIYQTLVGAYTRSATEI